MPAADMLRTVARSASVGAYFGLPPACGIYFASGPNSRIDEQVWI
jgi:hypothetical protein